MYRMKTDEWIRQDEMEKKKQKKMKSEIEIETDRERRIKKGWGGEDDDSKKINISSFTVHLCLMN